MFVFGSLLRVCSGAEGILGQHWLIIGAWQCRIVVVQYSTVRTVWRRLVTRFFAANRHYTHPLPASPHQTGSFLQSSDDTPRAIRLPWNGPPFAVSLHHIHTSSAQMYWKIATKCKCRRSIGGQPKKYRRYGTKDIPVRHHVKHSHERRCCNGATSDQWSEQYSSESYRSGPGTGLGTPNLNNILKSRVSRTLASNCSQ